MQVSDVELHRASEDPGRLYELAPGQHLEDRDGRVVTTNALGFRDAGERALAPTPGVPRILCLGGSNTFGATVSDGETWPARLEQALAAQGRRAEVWNLGVSGYMTRQKVAAGLAALERWSPDLLIVQIYNVGRRFVLYGTPLPGLLQRAPDLWREYLLGAPAPGERGWAAWQSSALLRAAVVGYNRVIAGPERDQALIERSEIADREALAALGRAAEGRAGVVVLIPPTGAPDFQLGGADWPLIDLSTGAAPPGEDGREIHPSAGVYAWYGEQIAARLIAGGCLERPPGCMAQ